MLTNSRQRRTNFYGPPSFSLDDFDFVAVGQEASKIVFETVKTRPQEVAQMLIYTSFSALRSYAPAMELRISPRWYPELMAALERFGPATQMGWQESAEYNGTIPVYFLSRLQRVIMRLTAICLVIGCIVAVRRGKMTLLMLPAFAGSAYFVNAVICGFTAGVFDRYQARISWLIILSVILVWANLFVSKAENNRPALDEQLSP